MHKGVGRKESFNEHKHSNHSSNIKQGQGRSEGADNEEQTGDEGE